MGLGILVRDESVGGIGKLVGVRVNADGEVGVE